MLFRSVSATTRSVRQSHAERCVHILSADYSCPHVSVLVLLCVRGALGYCIIRPSTPDAFWVTGTLCPFDTQRSLHSTHLCIILYFASSHCTAHPRCISTCITQLLSFPLHSHRSACTTSTPLNALLGTDSTSRAAICCINTTGWRGPLPSLLRLNLRHPAPLLV